MTRIEEVKIIIKEKARIIQKDSEHMAGDNASHAFFKVYKAKLQTLIDYIDEFNSIQL